MYFVIVLRQTTPIASYGPFLDRSIAADFIRVYLDHESSVHIVFNYGTFSEYQNRNEEQSK